MPKPAPRHHQMLRMPEEKGSHNVTELSEQFAVSLVTIRKDLDDLERQGLLQRTFGGAIFSHRSRFNSSFVEKTNQNLPQKRAIALAALEYIRDGDTILLDAGTTTLVLARVLKEHVRAVFVITSSVPAALELSSAGYDILLLGGMVRNKSLALLGRDTLSVIERYRADKAFLGSSGFTVEMGHAPPNAEDAQVKEAMIRASSETYVLVDSTKYGHHCLTSFARLRDVGLTITDGALSATKLRALQAAGAVVRTVEVPGTKPKPKARHVAAVA